MEQLFFFNFLTPNKQTKNKQSMKKFTRLLMTKSNIRCGILPMVLFLIGLMCSVSGYAQTTATFNASGNFITPAGVTTATVEAWGAGGAGGGSTSNSDGGGGGGGGAYSKSTGVSISGTIPVVVGAGGVGDTGAGNNGGDSTFNTTTIIAKGGTGGSVTSGTGGPGGAGGLSTASTGTTKFSGGTGGRGRDNNSGQGGPGGSSAGTAANGTSGAGSWSTVTASAAPTGGGKGGDGGTSGSAGAAGTAPGGGGGGAGDGTNNGGSGADGRVAITYTCPTYALTSAASATGPFCVASASVVTLRSSSMPNGTYTVSYNLSGGNTATGSTASMTFASGSGTFTTSTLNASTTATTITVTGISSGVVGQGACVSTISTNNTATVTVLTVVANAGTAFTKTCSANASGAVIGEATTSGYTYSWSPTAGLSSSTVSNPTANPTSTTTYTVTKTNTATNCSATATVTVTVDNTPPTAVAGANFTKTCTLNPTGKVIGETAVAGNTYSWSPTTGLSSSTVANPTANPTTTTTYTVTKTTTATGCSATASITVTVDIAVPTVSAGSAFTKTCVSNVSGATIGEANVSGFSYSWTPTAGLSSSTVSNPTANPTTTTTYTVTKTNNTNGCSATATVTVTVNNTLPTAAAGADFTKTCTTNPTGRAIGEATTAGFTYSWSPTAGLSSSTVSNPTANPTTTTTYTVTKTNTTTGCVGTDSILVTVDLTTPTVSAGNDFTKTCVTNPTGAAIGESAQSGHTYSWSPTAGLSSSTAANPTANPTTTTTYTVTKTNTTTGCTSTDSVTVTVDTTTPTVAALTGTQTVCTGSTTVFSSTTSGGTWGTSNAGIATVASGTVTGVAAGTTNINYTVTGANGCTTTVSRSVTVNPLPTAVVASGAASICDGTSTNLTGSATISSVSTTTPINDNFNGTPTFASAGSGTIFAQKNSGDAVGLTTITNNVDTSKYMITSASSFGSASTTSTLTSPAINTSGLSTLSFTYNHSYTRGNSGTNTAVVQVSTDNTNWTTVKTYTTNQGANNNFVADNINLDAYVNNTALRVRFNTTISVNFGTGWWAVENPKLTATAPIAAQYSWSADTASGVNGLPSGAGTPATGNASISVNPTATTNYNLVATDPLTGCNVTSASVQVIVKPLPSVTAPSNQTHCNGVTVAATTLSGTSGATYDISGGAAIGLANATGVTQIPSYTAIAGSAVVSVTPKLNGCTGTAVTYNVVVNPTPTVTAPANQSYCDGISVSALTLSGTPSGVTFDISGGSAIGLADATDVTAIPAFTATTGSAVITLTPKANGCTGTAVTFNITVNPVLTPAFAAVASVCSGTTLAALPTTSLNGVTGSWSPALNNTATTTYTFTPTSGLCATTVTLEIVVNPNVTPTFDAIAPICSGAALSALPTTSNNGISGTWSPALNNTATTTYTFTPTSGLCAFSTTLEIVVTPKVTPAFDAIAPICAGAALSALPTTSNNGISGIWSPALDNTTTTTYTFTPALSECAFSTTLEIVVNPILTPNFTAVAPICAGASLAALPTVSNNGVSGTWSPALNNTTTTTYTFSPNIGECAEGNTLEIVVNPLITPTFASVAAICSGDSLAALPTTSLNGITGSWAPALNNTATTTYTFVPDAGPCTSAILTTLTITVNVPTTYYSDSDSDGFGDVSNSLNTCSGLPVGYVTNHTDCAPGDGTKWRTANFFIDADGDTFNNGFPAMPVCYGASTPSGFVAINYGTDCDDTLSSVNSNASEVLGNGIDDNCDGAIDEVTPTSHLIESSCGITLQNLSHTLFAYQLTNFRNELGPVQAYRFRVTNGATVRVYDTTASRFSLTDLPGGATYATTYTVEVSAKTGGYFRAYGLPCTVTTPSVPNGTYITNPINGSTLNDISNTIFCRMVPSATGYRFRVKLGNTVIGTYSSNTNRFNLVNLGISNIAFATTYTIDVLLKFDDEFRPDSEYGPTAQITTPATPAKSRVISPSCGSMINNLWTTIFAQQVLGAQGYKFVVTNGAQTREFTTPNPRFSLQNLPGRGAANTTYTIRVDVLYNSSYVEGTTTCTITTLPTASRQAASALDIYEVNAYPNPFTEGFQLSINTSAEDTVGLKVYDMLGREVESLEGTVDEMTHVALGARYPSGVYNVIVTQGMQVKTLRVIKR